MYRPMTDRNESPIYPDTQDPEMMSASELAYLTLDFNTFNFPLDLDYLVDVT